MEDCVTIFFNLFFFGGGGGERRVRSFIGGAGGLKLNRMDMITFFFFLLLSGRQPRTRKRGRTPQPTGPTRD